jgi:uncharacterized membrane protein YvbJ
MIHKFCVNCGVKNSFQATPPNFCCGCGKPFNKVLSSSQASQDVDNEEQEEASVVIPPKESLASGWGASQVGMDNQLTFGSLYNNPTKPVGKNQRPEPKNTSGDILKQSIEECRSVKESKEIGG